MSYESCLRQTMTCNCFMCKEQVQKRSCITFDDTETILDHVSMSICYKFFTEKATNFMPLVDNFHVQRKRAIWGTSTLKQDLQPWDFPSDIIQMRSQLNRLNQSKSTLHALHWVTLCRRFPAMGVYLQGQIIHFNRIFHHKHYAIYAPSSLKGTPFTEAPVELQHTLW